MGTRLLWACLCLALLTHGALAQGSSAAQGVLGYVDTNGKWHAYDTTGAGIPTSGGGGGGGAVTLPLTPSIANGSGVVPTQGGTALSTTNGAYNNLLQGNAVLSTGNPIFVQNTAGSAAIGSITNTSFAATQSGTWTVSGNTSTDGSTTITAGGTAQNLFSGATPAHGFEICNPGTVDDLWVSDSTTAAANNTGSYRVALNGGCYVTPAGRLPIGAVSIVGATTGDKITARSW